MKTLAAVAIMVLAMVGCTSYDEMPETVLVRVILKYPDGSPVEAYRGARVELTNANASTFVDSTNAEGIATFNVPGGIYDAATSETFIDTVSGPRHWRYIFNGRSDRQVISPDSAANDITIELTMTRRRYWN